MTVSVREAHEDEADLLLGIQREAAIAAYAHVFPQERYPFPDAAVRAEWDAALRDPEVEVYVTDGGPLGTVSIGHGFLRTLYVVPAGWRRGIGSALHDHALERLRARGFHEARLWTLAENEVARAFYERRGWRLTTETRVVPYPPYPIDVQYVRPL